MAELLNDPLAHLNFESECFGIRDATLMCSFLCIFFCRIHPGGHGAVLDLPNDPHVQNILQDAATNAKLIASVCHGPAAFTTVSMCSLHCSATKLLSDVYYAYCQ